VGPRVLVVDDELVVCKALERELRSDFEVVVAHDAQTALDLVPEHDPPSAVVSDFQLGKGPNGLDLLAEVKARGPTIARILVSATCELEELSLAFDEEIIHQFIAKPWRFGDVLGAVRRWTTALQATMSRSGPLAIGPKRNGPRRSSG
jgi:DNA-binding NtrC family response regulator